MYVYKTKVHNRYTREIVHELFDAVLIICASALDTINNFMISSIGFILSAFVHHNIATLIYLNLIHNCDLQPHSLLIII